MSSAEERKRQKEEFDRWWARDEKRRTSIVPVSPAPVEPVTDLGEPIAETSPQAFESKGETAEQRTKALAKARKAAEEVSRKHRLTVYERQVAQAAEQARMRQEEMKARARITEKYFPKSRAPADVRLFRALGLLPKRTKERVTK